MSVNGLVVMTPTSIASTGTGNSSSIGANGKVTFSSCETLSLNGVFTSSYDNYMISLAVKGSDSSVSNYIRLRNAGTDDSGNNYTVQRIEVDNTSITALRQSSISGFRFGEFGTPPAGKAIYIFGPKLSQPTAAREVNVNTYNEGTYLFEYCGTHNQSTGYDGFTFTSLASGLSTGTITVYGFNQ